MGKIKSSVVFKTYDQQQGLLLPPCLDELIPANSLVRVVNDIVEQMDLSGLINQYDGGGAPPSIPGCCSKYCSTATPSRSTPDAESPKPSLRTFTSCGSVA